MEFYGFQCFLHKHMLEEGEDWRVACDDVPAHVARSDQPVRVEQEVEVGGEALAAQPEDDDFPLPPVTELDALPESGDQDEVRSEAGSVHSNACSVQSNLSAAAAVFTPTRPPTTPAGVRRISPADEQLGGDHLGGETVVETPGTEGEGEPMVEQTAELDYGAGADETWTVTQVSQPVSTDEAVTAWVAGLVTAVAVTKGAEPAVGMATASTQTPQKLEHRPQHKHESRQKAWRALRYGGLPTHVIPDAGLKYPPRSQSPEYSSEFFDAGPTHQEAFRVVAGAVAEHEPDTVSFDHALFHEAVRLKRLNNPKRYCRHVRRA
ncbi:hypothetical protein MTO96_046552 [Rhipicephalus appendiculatus]